MLVQRNDCLDCETCRNCGSKDPYCIEVCDRCDSVLFEDSIYYDGDDCEYLDMSGKFCEDCARSLLENSDREFTDKEISEILNDYELQYTYH